MFFKISTPNNLHRSTGKHKYRSKEHIRATASERVILQKHSIVSKHSVQEVSHGLYPAISLAKGINFCQLSKFRTKCVFKNLQIKAHIAKKLHCLA